MKMRPAALRVIIISRCDIVRDSCWIEEARLGRTDVIVMFTSKELCFLTYYNHQCVRSLQAYKRIIVHYLPDKHTIIVKVFWIPCFAINVCPWSVQATLLFHHLQRDSGEAATQRVH
jgi:hypothetical protein